MTHGSQTIKVPQQQATSALAAFKADTWRQFGRFSWPQALTGAVSQRNYRVLATLRLCQGAARGRGILSRALLLVARVLHRVACNAAAVEIPWRTRILPGLALTHGQGTVISQHVAIGRNVTVFHGVTLGWGEKILQDGSRVNGGTPVIEDEVWIGPHAIVAGPVTVGRGSRIGAGALVVRDVPPHSIVVGNPGHVVKRDCVPDVVNRCDF